MTDLPAPRPETPEDLRAIATLLERAFESEAREAALWELLRASARYDSRWTWIVPGPERLRAAAIALPREILVRGSRLRGAVLGPVAVDPDDQGADLGRSLVKHVLEALGPQVDAVWTVGPPRFFASLGFQRAFGQTRLGHRLPTHDVPAYDWRGIRGEDLEACRGFFERCHAAISGAEIRTLEPFDWDSPHELVHTVCLEEQGSLRGYVRFLASDRLLVKEAAVAEERDWEGLLGFLARLGREHQQNLIELLTPPGHPLHRRLLRAGGQASTHDLGGSLLMHVPSPTRVLERLFSSPNDRLKGFSGTRVDLYVGRERIPVLVKGNRIRVERESRRKGVTAHLSKELWPGLLTGLEPLEDALQDPLPPRERELLATLFPPWSSQWLIAPLYDVCELDAL